MPSKDTETLIRAIHDQSKGQFKVVSGGKHKKIIWAKDAPGNKAGQAVRDENGPLILSDTPGEHRNRELAVHRMLKAGVLKFDPWKPPQGKDSVRDNQDGNVSREEQFDQKEARRLAVADSHRKTNAATKELRERVEPMVVKLGGWDKRGFRSELGWTAFAFLNSIDHTPRWPTKESAIMSAHSLAKGQTLSTQACTMWHKFFEELDNSFTPRERYFELVRAAKGLLHVLPPKAGPLAQRANADGVLERVVQPEPGDSTRGMGPFGFVNLARLHERTGLKWSMGLTIDEYAELQRAYGFMEAVILRDYGDQGAKALSTISEFLIKMGEARFYSMTGRPEVEE